MFCVFFARAVQRGVLRQNERGGGGHAQVGLESGVAEFPHFVQQRGGRHDDPGSDEASRAGSERAGGNEVQGDFLLADDEGMSGVVSPLEARDAMGVFGEEVDNLAFPSSPHCSPTTATTLTTRAPAQRADGKVFGTGGMRKTFSQL